MAAHNPFAGMKDVAQVSCAWVLLAYLQMPMGPTSGMTEEAMGASATVCVGDFSPLRTGARASADSPSRSQHAHDAELLARVQQGHLGQAFCCSFHPA